MSVSRPFSLVSVVAVSIGHLLDGLEVVGVLRGVLEGVLGFVEWLQVLGQASGSPGSQVPHIYLAGYGIGDKASPAFTDKINLFLVSRDSKVQSSTLFRSLIDQRSLLIDLWQDKGESLERRTIG